MRHILLATDGSDSAKHATEVAADLARDSGGRLSILTVETDAIKGVKRFAKVEGEIGDAFEEFAALILNEAKEAAEKCGVASIDVHSGWGDPAEVIIEKARDAKVDAIVVGRRGRGRLEGLLLGSVSQKLVSLAPCTVVVVP